VREKLASLTVEIDWIVVVVVVVVVVVGGRCRHRRCSFVRSFVRSLWCCSFQLAGNRWLVRSFVRWSVGRRRSSIIVVVVVVIPVVEFNAVCCGSSSTSSIGGLLLFSTRVLDS